MDPSTAAARAPGAPDPTFGGLVAPIVPSTTYVRDDQGGYPGGHSYTRDQNPTGEPAEALLAELEGGDDALLFASGMAAATALLDAWRDSVAAEAGPTTRLAPHVVAPRHMYWTIRRWFEHERDQGRLRLTLVDTVEPDAWDAALVGSPGPCLVWLETPSNPMGVVTDLSAVATVGHRHGALVVADSTTATPVHTRPLDHGVDVVVHSATKQLNGHGDVLAGALVTADPTAAVWAGVRHQRGYRGAVLGPFEAWLLLRGLRTLFVRVPRSSSTALAIATALHDHPAIAEVRYPGLSDHPGHDIATRQMTGGFGMLVSVRLQGGEKAARRVLRRLDLFSDATSLGSTESLVEHRVRIEGDGSPVPADLLRLSIGLEHPDDLLADLHQALAPEVGRA
jgi:cystathionine gamma-synthase